MNIVNFFLFLVFVTREFDVGYGPGGEGEMRRGEGELEIYLKEKWKRDGNWDR